MRDPRGARHRKIGDRRAEVRRIESTQEFRRHGGVAEIHHHLIAELAQIDRDMRIGQLDHDSPGAVAAAAEADGADLPGRSQSGVRRRRALGTLDGCGLVRIVGACRARPEGHENRIALLVHTIGHHRVEIQHQARTAARPGGRDRLQPVRLDADLVRGQGELGIRQVDDDARRVVHGERQRLRRRSGQLQRELHLPMRQLLHPD